MLKYDIFTKNLNDEGMKLFYIDTLFTSGLYKYILLEILIILLHPSVLTQNYKLTYVYTDVQKKYTLIYELNDFLFSVLTFRIIFIARFFLTYSYYKRSRSARMCRLYGEYNSYSFSVRCVFNNNPFGFVLILLCSGILFFTINIRVYERVFDSQDRIDPDVKLGLNFTSWTNSIWCTFITMMTGYFIKISRIWRSIS